MQIEGPKVRILKENKQVGRQALTLWRGLARAPKKEKEKKKVTESTKLDIRYK